MNKEKNLKVERVLKIALENMYMFGGCIRPDPKYDEYLGKMINLVMATINKEYGTKRPQRSNGI